ncbi:hypothetical protein ACFLZZ_01335 [Nanoarchaeota archaeon]
MEKSDHNLEEISDDLEKISIEDLVSNGIMSKEKVKEIFPHWTNGNGKRKDIKEVVKEIGLGERIYDLGFMIKDYLTTFRTNGKNGHKKVEVPYKFKEDTRLIEAEKDEERKIHTYRAFCGKKIKAKGAFEKERRKILKAVGSTYKDENLLSQVRNFVSDNREYLIRVGKFALFAGALAYSYNLFNKNMELQSKVKQKDQEIEDLTKGYGIIHKINNRQEWAINKLLAPFDRFYRTRDMQSGEEDMYIDSISVLIQKRNKLMSYGRDSEAEALRLERAIKLRKPKDRGKLKWQKKQRMDEAIVAYRQAAHIFPIMDESFAKHYRPQNGGRGYGNKRVTRK